MHQSPTWTCSHSFSRVACLLLLPAVVAVGTDVEDCHSSGSTLKDAVAEDGDLPLSLMQVNAVKTRNNRTHHVNESFGHTEVLPNVTFSKSWLPGSRFAEGLDSLRVFYMVFAILVLFFAIHSSGYCQREEKGKKHSKPKIKHSVDHLVATSKLTQGAKAEKSQLSFYTRAKPDRDFLSNPAGVPSQCPAAVDLAAADKPTSEQPSMEQKQQHCAMVEALDPKLVLPLRETWYAVAIEKALTESGSFEILRISGSQSLRACIRYDSSGCGGELELFCSSGGAAHHLLARASTNGSNLTLVDAQERCIGDLRPTVCKSFELVRKGERIFSLDVDDAGQLELSTAGGRSDACVSCLAGHLGICVNAGADTGLVVCLVLGAVLLGGARAHVLPNASCGRVGEEKFNEDGGEPVVCSPDASECSGSLSDASLSD